MAHGLPVVSSNATCLPEVLGDAAVYFDPRSDAKMADAMLSVLSDEKLSNDLIKKGLKQVKKYSWKQTAKETLKIYEKAMQNKKQQ
jgi:glycosyltransferase involved in cell wall biosynthesis